ncbi:hypothetical protein Tco_1025741, partial [Tanacetum coccineum]
MFPASNLHVVSELGSIEGGFESQFQENGVALRSRAEGVKGPIETLCNQKAAARKNDHGRKVSSDVRPRRPRSRKRPGETLTDTASNLHVVSELGSIEGGFESQFQENDVALRCRVEGVKGPIETLCNQKAAARKNDRGRKVDGSKGRLKPYANQVRVDERRSSCLLNASNLHVVSELGSIEGGFESQFQENGVALRCRAEGKAREDSKNKSKEDVSESMSMGNIHIGGLESHLLDVPDLELARYVVPTGRYVVPTGRVVATDSVIVATSGYVVPAAYDISSGRV